jgi:hypothetical protein
MKPQTAARWPDVGHEDFYAQLVEYAAALVQRRSRRKIEPSGILRDLVGPIEGTTLHVRDIVRDMGRQLSDLKRPRRGQPSRPGRFFADPNHVAAAIAAGCVEDWRGTPIAGSKRRGPYKLRCADGSMSNARDAAARFAVKLVNERYIPLLPRNHRSREAKFDTVIELLKRSRTKWPSGADGI